MSGFDGIGKVLVLVGLFIVLFGVLIMLWHRLPVLGKLPGGITIRRGGFHLFIPLVTSLFISLILTGVLNIVFRDIPIANGG